MIPLNVELKFFSGKRSTSNAQRSTPNAQRPTLNAQRSTLHAQRSLNAQRSTLNAQRPPSWSHAKHVPEGGEGDGCLELAFHSRPLHNRAMNSRKMLAWLVV